MAVGSRWKTFALAATSLSILMCVWASPSLAAPGTLDPSFGNAGTVVRGIGTGGPIAADGANVVQVGEDAKGWVIARYLPDGKLDTSFGAGGVVHTQLPQGFASAVAVEPDGEILVAGDAMPKNLMDVAVGAYLSDGSPDPKFNGGSPLIEPVGAAGAQGTSVGAQSNGQIVVGGTAYGYNAKLGQFFGEFMLLLVSRSGAVQTTTMTDVSNGQGGGASALTVLPNDQVVLAGFADTGKANEFALARYDNLGSLDTTFGNSGIATLPIGSDAEANALARQSDGKLVAGGDATIGGRVEFALARFDADGSVDQAFGAGQPVVQQLSSGGASANAVRVMPQGQILAGGEATVGGRQRFAAARYNSDGSPDTTFNPGASPANASLVQVGDGAATADGIVPQPGARILLGGQASLHKAPQFALARLGAPSTLSTTIALASSAPVRAGQLAVFHASTQIPPGFHVYEYRWSWNAHGRWNVDTGSYPFLEHRFSKAGRHTVRVQVLATDNEHRVTSATGILSAGVHPPAPGCSSSVELGFLEFISQCITNDNGKYSISLDGGAGFAGLQLRSNQAGAKVTLDTTGSDSDHPHHWILSADGPVTVSMLDTPIGTVNLATVDLHRNPVVLPFGADAPDQNAPGLRVLTLEALGHCPASGSVPPVVCSQLPGPVDVEGGISVYVTGGVSGEDLGAAAQLNIHWHRGIDLTGHVTLTGDASGLNIDSFGVQTQSFPIGRILTVDPVMFEYDRRACRSGDPTCPDSQADFDVYKATAGVHLTAARALVSGITLAVRIANGNFQQGTFDIRGNVPLGPVVLQRLGGTLGFNPFSAGLNIGGIIGPLQLSAGVFYSEASGPDGWHFQIGSEDPDHDPHHVAPLFVAYPSVNPVLKIGGALDLYGDGFISGGITVQFALPNVDSTNKNVDVRGFVRGWFMPASPPAAPTPSYQISGGVSVEVHALIHIYGAVEGFINNYWQGGVHHNVAAGCGEVRVDLGPFGQPSVGGWVRVDLAQDNHVDDGFGGCDDISAYCAPAEVTGDHNVPPCLGFAADAASAPLSHRRQRFWIPAGRSVENLRINSAIGLPRVRISGPSGSYTTPATPTTTGHWPVYVSGGDSAEHQLALAILKPKPGVYTITPLAGSPAIEPVLEAHPLPNPNIHVRVSGHGASRILRYTMHSAKGQTVQFIERAGGVSHVIGVGGGARGAIRFVSQAAPARRRTIVAIVYEKGVAQMPRTVGSYTASPVLSLPAPRRLRLHRRHNLLTITWSAVRGATGYQVLVIGSDGRHDLYVEPAGRRTLRIAPVFRNVALTVRTRTVGGAFNQPGASRVARLRRGAG
jgi:uncharacterized delta-60 repeat protein